MAEIYQKYTLFLQNNASKAFHFYDGLEDIGNSHLYHHFDLELDLPDGEYTYALVINNRDDCEYEFKTPLLDTIIHTGDGDTVLRYLQPDTGLLRIGNDIPATNIYDNNEKKDIYYYE